MRAYSSIRQTEWWRTDRQIRPDRQTDRILVGGTLVSTYAETDRQTDRQTDRYY